MIVRAGRRRARPPPRSSSRGSRRRPRCRSSDRASGRRRGPRRTGTMRPRKNAWRGRAMGDLLAGRRVDQSTFKVHFAACASIGPHDGLLRARRINSHLRPQLDWRPDDARGARRRPRKVVARATGPSTGGSPGPSRRRSSGARSSPASRLPSERVARGGARRLAHDGRLGLRGAARGGSRREPAGKRHARARLAATRAGAAPAGGSRRAPSAATPSTAASSTARATRSSFSARTCRRRSCSRASSLRVDEKALRELTRGPGYLPMGLPALRAAIARHLTRVGRADDRGPGARDPRRAAGDRPGGRALPRARRRGRRGGPDVPRLDRHLHRPRRAPRWPCPSAATPRGWRACKELVTRTAPRLIYLMPTFQNPTGAVMPEACRRALARLSPRDAASRSSRTTRSRTCRSAASLRAPIAAFDAAAPGADHRLALEALLGRPAHRLDPRLRGAAGADHAAEDHGGPRRLARRPARRGAPARRGRARQDRRGGARCASGSTG